jgi:hypothetical protein
MLSSKATVGLLIWLIALVACSGGSTTASSVGAGGGASLGGVAGSSGGANQADGGTLPKGANGGTQAAGASATNPTSSGTGGTAAMTNGGSSATAAGGLTGGTAATATGGRSAIAAGGLTGGTAATATGGRSANTAGSTSGENSGIGLGGTLASGGSGVGITGGSTGSPLKGTYVVLAWNDLGMHCMDGKDYSVFSILPPYNNLHAQVVRVDVTSGKLVNASTPLTLTYEAVADTANSSNTMSSTKTNFWTWVGKLYGANPELDHGLNLGDPNISNPTPSHTPAGLTYGTAQAWWHAEGIPITPYPDDYATNGGIKNFYPMVKVVATDSTHAVLATTSVVLPVSDEMSCKSCHASDGGYSYTKPSAGWVNDTTDPEKDWKKNILRLHDDKHPDAIAIAGMASKYSGGSLSATMAAGQPILCAACHQSNALGTAAKAGIKPLTEAIHSLHANVYQVGTTTTLDSISTRNSCYSCHPGAATKCLRGAMGNAIDPTTKLPSIDCQSCHGNMSLVGKTGRQGWLDEPSCQNCHDRASSSSATFTRYTSVFSSGTTVRTNVDSRFATNPDTPAAGKSLYRFSTGHGGLQCEACHGSTHAEYPSSDANDNVQSLALQGHTGTINECTVCHSTMPTTANAGPHGMHEVGQTWVTDHHSGSVSRSTCQQCHGTTSSGSPLAVVKSRKTLNAGEFGNKTFAAGDRVTCWSCHNGPNP